LQINRIPQNYRIGHQVQTISLCLLFFRESFANVAFISEEQKSSQRMKRFTFIELAIYSAAEIVIQQISQNKLGFLDFAVFLQGTGEIIFARERL